jgi:hypothetical protein
MFMGMTGLFAWLPALGPWGNVAILGLFALYVYTCFCLRERRSLGIYLVDVCGVVVLLSTTVMFTVFTNTFFYGGLHPTLCALAWLLTMVYYHKRKSVFEE